MAADFEAGQRMNNPATVDLLVIGGGVNGAGVARDAAGRGLSVVLCEKGDLAGGTSSRSGKLVHGGLRYLEYYEFRLVREALIEREVLLASAPHIIWPMRFVLPHSPQDRPAWLIRAGLFLYDHLGGRRQLPPTRVLKLRECGEGKPLLAEYSKGFEYSDCWVDDARLVILNAIDASRHGATILTRNRFNSARRVDNIWQAEITDQQGRVSTVRARAIVNAAGPWVNDVLDDVTDASSSRSVRLVKGSHIVVKKFWHGDHAYLLQNIDKRVIFVNPYESEYALIGTTDIPQQESADNTAIDASEIDYLVTTVNRYFTQKLSASDIVHAFSGVRPLYDDNADNPSAVTRDYVFDIDEAPGQAPLVSVFGGKITTFRKLSEHLLDRLQPWFSAMGKPWTRDAKLPGGDIPDADFDAFVQAMQQHYAWLDTATTEHLSRCYGTLIHQVLADAESLDDLGEKFAPRFFEREVRYLIDHEWAASADDVLSRRTKHGLHLSTEQKRAFEDWWQRNIAMPPTSNSNTAPDVTTRAGETAVEQ